MQIAVFSDTHGNTARMTAAVRETRPDAIIHLGDYARDVNVLRRDYPEIPLYAVSGNCDVALPEPLTGVVELGPVKAFLTHGHLYDVDWHVDSLVYAAQEQGCQLALYGHTHRPDSQELGGVKVVNPGTAGQGRRLSYAWITIFDNGGIGAEIREL